ncbi:hypothetical protein J2808_001633 [Pseudarthrobacter sulfonivorans]|nr:hypothetical protein [Pseudarthrobacter sulfonivorans]MDR6414893.1 hypothetical protein [Pseudarthrobacter sulfonivorans]
MVKLGPQALLRFCDYSLSLPGHLPRKFDLMVVNNLIELDTTRNCDGNVSRRECIKDGAWAALNHNYLGRGVKIKNFLVRDHLYPWRMEWRAAETVLNQAARGSGLLLQPFIHPRNQPVEGVVIGPEGNNGFRCSVKVHSTGPILMASG